MCAIVSIERPAGFLKSQNHQGFEQPSTGATIVVTELPVPMSLVVDGFTEVALARQGMRLLHREVLCDDSRSRLLILVEQSKGSVSVKKWITVLGNEGQSVMVTATFPRHCSEQLAEAMHEVALSVSWNPDVSSMQVAAVGPGGDMPGLRFATPFGNMAIYTQDGTHPVTDPEAPLFIAGCSESDKLFGSDAGFAEYRIKQIAETTNVRIVSNESISVDDLPGYETVAEAISTANDARLTLYQMILFDKAFYFLAQGIVGEKAAQEYLPKFKHLAGQFKRIRSTQPRSSTKSQPHSTQHHFDPMEPD